MTGKRGSERMGTLEGAPEEGNGPLRAEGHSIL